MKTLYRYIIVTYVGPVFLTLFIVVFIFLMQFLWVYIDELVGKGLKWNVMLEFIGWLSITFVPMSLPLSTLLSAIMTMGNLGEDNELLAMKSSGISLQRILLPLYGIVGLIVIFSFLMSSDLVPKSYLKMRMMFSDIRKKNPELNIPVGIFYNEIPGYSLRVDDKNPVTGALHGLMIYDHTARNGNTTLIISDSGYIKQTDGGDYIILRLINGVVYDEQAGIYRAKEKAYPFNKRTFTEQTVVVPVKQIESGANESMFKDMAQSQSLKSLSTAIDSVSKNRDTTFNDFTNVYLKSSSCFKSNIEMDTAQARRAALKYPFDSDSIFLASSAVNKMNYLNVAQTKAKFADESWKISLLSLENTNKKYAGLRYEWHRKFTLSLACMIFFFIGAPLGAIIRKGGLGMPIVISVFFFIFYWVIDSVCRKMVHSGGWNPLLGAWMPSFILAPAAAFLTRKSNTDSQLFNYDAYKKFFDIVSGKTEKLVEFINLDNIKPLNREEFIAVSEIEGAKIKEINNLCYEFYEKYKSVRAFADRSDMISDLKKLEENYNYMLSYYAVIDDNERLRTIIKSYPVLNSNKYKMLKLSEFNKIIMTAIFPVRIFYSIIASRKRRQLNHIINEIQTVNNLIIYNAGKDSNEQ